MFICSTPPRIIRGQRNASQNPANIQSAQREQQLDIKISSDIIETFKDLSSDNSAARIETGAILAGRKIDDYYILDTIFIPQQVGHADRFEKTNE